MSQIRRNPGTSARAASTTTTVAGPDSSLYRRQDGYCAPTADERREHQLLEELRALGYMVAVRCLACQRPLTAGVSVARHIGPKCHARAVGA